jgi:hypothetical protein
VLFCGKLKAWMICASVKAQLSGVHKRLARENNSARKMISGMKCGNCIGLTDQKKLSYFFNCFWRLAKMNAVLMPVSTKMGQSHVAIKTQKARPSSTELASALSDLVGPSLNKCR